MSFLGHETGDVEADGPSGSYKLVQIDVNLGCLGKDTNYDMA